MKHLDFSFDFSMAFVLLKRALNFFAIIISVLSYYHACEHHDEELNKLLQTLTASDSKSRVLM